jgi:hypothetical protein
LYLLYYLFLKYFQLKAFSLQFFHEKMELTAAGLFTIDVQLVFSVSSESVIVQIRKKILDDGGLRQLLYYRVAVFTLQ